MELFFTQPEEKHARDPLGLTTLVRNKREEILPGITSTTARARYYLLCSIYEKLRYEKTKKSTLRKNLPYYLDILFLSSNLKKPEHILGRSKIHLFGNSPKSKKLSKIKQRWIKTNFLQYYWASFKKLFKKDNQCPLSEKEIRNLIKCIEGNSEPINYLRVDNPNKRIQDWLKDNILGKGNEKISRFYRFIKRFNTKDKYEFLQKIFMSDTNKYKEYLGDIPIVERYLWAIETIFNILLNLLGNDKSFDYQKIKVQKFDQDEYKFLKNWNEDLDNELEKKRDEELQKEEPGKDEENAIKIQNQDAKKMKEKLERIIGYLNYLKKNYSDDIYENLISELGTWIASDDICESILKHHYEIKGEASFIERHDGKWRLKRGIKGEEFGLFPFPKHYYGIYNFLWIMEDLGELKKCAE